MTNPAKMKKTNPPPTTFPPAGENLFSKLGYISTVANSVLTGLWLHLVTLFCWGFKSNAPFDTSLMLNASGATWFQITAERKPGKRSVYRGSF